MFDNLYKIDDNSILTPSLIYYKDIIISNIKKAIEIAGGPNRLWPHVKSHKMKDMVKLQQNLGINKFKCATIAEAEMLVNCQVDDVLLAYPLIGPNINRFIKLQKSAVKSRLWAIGDNFEQLSKLSEQSINEGIITRVLIDVNLGMNRTGVPLNELEELYRSCYSLKGIELQGLHCYDGNHNNKDIEIRKSDVRSKVTIINKIKKSLEGDGLDCSILVMGGTPSFPCHSEYSNVYLSPGTAFINDYGYSINLPDLDFIPGAAIATRVISHPNKDIFTLDLGYKGIASDPVGVRGIIIDFEDKVTPLFQSEEHWVFKMNEGFEDSIPDIGTLLYVIPTHICPTSALYSGVLVAENNKIVDTWKVTARNRKITI